jgi:hypothetical protein
MKSLFTGRSRCNKDDNKKKKKKKVRPQPTTYIVGLRRKACRKDSRLASVTDGIHRRSISDLPDLID